MRRRDDKLKNGIVHNRVNDRWISLVTLRCTIVIPSVRAMERCQSARGSVAKAKEDRTMEMEISLIKDALDAELGGRQPTIGIGLSLRLFDEFRKRGWLTIERFGEWGIDAPAYHSSHPAFCNWQLPGLEFRVGGGGEGRKRGLPKAFSPWPAKPIEAP
jgi:hypothetical protein